MRVLWLYAELAPYFLGCLCHWARKNPAAHITVVHLPVNPVAPFRLEEMSLPENIELAEMSKARLKHLQSIAWEGVLVSGWLVKRYLYWSWRVRARVRVLLFDTPWLATLKQRIIATMGWRRLFDRAWVPGMKQKEFALRMGFREEEVETGFYCAEVERFAPVWGWRLHEHIYIAEAPRLLFVGRVSRQKGADLLLEAFGLVHRHLPAATLTVVGKCEDVPTPQGQEGVRYVAFAQPWQLPQYYAETDFFVLPSRYEPWGVVVHEAAMCGVPLLLSTNVGAGELFLREGESGAWLDISSVEALACTLLQGIERLSTNYKRVCQKTHNLALSLTPEKWADTLERLLLC